jgi:hypothetical protein
MNVPAESTNALPATTNNVLGLFRKNGIIVISDLRWVSVSSLAQPTTASQTNEERTGRKQSVVGPVPTAAVPNGNVLPEIAASGTENGARPGAGAPAERQGRLNGPCPTMTACPPTSTLSSRSREAVSVAVVALGVA